MAQAVLEIPTKKNNEVVVDVDTAMKKKKNRIQVSNNKKPLFFYLNLAKRYIKQHNNVELSALGMAIPTVVTIAEILKANGLAKEKKVLTSTVGSKDENKGRLVQKAKLEIVLEKPEKPKNQQPKTEPESTAGVESDHSSAVTEASHGSDVAEASPDSAGAESDHSSAVTEASHGSEVTEASPDSAGNEESAVSAGNEERADSAGTETSPDSARTEESADSAGSEACPGSDETEVTSGSADAESSCTGAAPKHAGTESSCDSCESK